MDNLQVYPTKFEAYDEDLPVFTVEAYDDCSANVNITACVNATEWPAISASIHEALKAMKLRGDHEDGL